MQLSITNCTWRTTCGLSRVVTCMSLPPKISSTTLAFACKPSLFDNGGLRQGWHSTSRKSNKDTVFKRYKKGGCRAALPDDAPFAVAIGASILSTLVLPTSLSDQEAEQEEDSLFGPDDVISGVKQVISFIPLFNWMVWLFAWLDTRQQKYLFFAMIYLAPYLKSGLSLSPDDSWLPVASLVAGVVHVQLDISVNSKGAQPPLGDISRVLLEKVQMKNLGDQADGLVNRLKELGAKTDVRQFEKTIQDDDPKSGAEWKAIEEEAQRSEFEEWDKKLSRSKAVEEAVEETETEI